MQQKKWLIMRKKLDYHHTFQQQHFIPEVNGMIYFKCPRTGNKIQRFCAQPDLFSNTHKLINM